jgi:hypothetical protein
VLLGIAHDAGATSCICTGSFVDNARRAGLVVRAKAVGFEGSWGNGRPRYVRLAVSRVYAGDPSIANLLVEGDDGNSLRRDASGFEPGSEWLLDLDYSRAITSNGKRTVVYEASVCGSHALRIEKGVVAASGCEDSDDGKPVGEVVDRLRAALTAPADPTPAAAATPAPER